MFNMRTDITVDKIMKEGDIKLNKSELARQYGCCWETIDRRLNPSKYVHERKKRIYHSKLDEYKKIIDEKLELQNIPASGIYYLLKSKYGYDGNMIIEYKNGKVNEIIEEFYSRIRIFICVDSKEK